MAGGGNASVPVRRRAEPRLPRATAAPVAVSTLRASSSWRSRGRRPPDRRRWRDAVGGVAV